jgi:hypothetical protein
MKVVGKGKGRVPPISSGFICRVVISLLEEGAVLVVVLVCLVVCEDWETSIGAVAEVPGVDRKECVHDVGTSSRGGADRQVMTAQSA